MTTNHLLRIVFLFAALLCWPGQELSAQEDLPPRLKEFLSKSSFPELIKRFDQETVEITTVGRRARALAERTYTLGKGYRVQAFAGTQRNNAEQIATKLRSIQTDSVYMFQTQQGLYKVQVGDFTKRVEAELLMQELRYNDIQGVWVVETEIREPKTILTRPEPQPQEVNAAPEAPQEEFIPPTTIYYSIQIFATRERDKALDLRDRFAAEVNQPVEVVEQNSFWKVMVGQFDDRPEAERYIQTLNKRRFGDAWITQLVRQ